MKTNPFTINQETTVSAIRKKAPRRINYQIRTYRKEISIKENTFFILSRGNNTGKPLKKPCPNCFIVETATKKDKELLYWLTYSLWQAKTFYPHLIGSVIMFIRIKEVKEILNDGLQSMAQNPETYHKNLKIIQNIEQQLSNIQKQKELLIQAKQMILRKTLL